MNNQPTNQLMELISRHAHHEEYETYLDEANLSVGDMLNVCEELFNLHSVIWQALDTPGGSVVNPFDVISYLEARVALLARTGDEGYADWQRSMWELAIRYSDQAGLSRKFSLFTELIASTKADLSREERSVYFYTRALNRLALLTDYWYGEDEARPLWRELMEYALASMEGDEQQGALNIISENAPWFARENASVFACEEAREEQKGTTTVQLDESFIEWGNEHFPTMPVGAVWAPEGSGVEYRKITETTFQLLFVLDHSLAQEHHEIYTVLMETCGYTLLAS